MIDLDAIEARQMRFDNAGTIFNDYSALIAEVRQLQGIAQMWDDREQETHDAMEADNLKLRDENARLRKLLRFAVNDYGSTWRPWVDESREILGMTTDGPELT